VACDEREALMPVAVVLMRSAAAATKKNRRHARFLLPREGAGSRPAIVRSLQSPGGILKMIGSETAVDNKMVSRELVAKLGLDELRSLLTAAG